jgi:hypothetical protein
MSQLIESTMVTGRNVEVKKNVNFEDRCVPVPAVSTFGLALMLSWAIKKAEGVIADPGSEASNAVTLVDRMVATACELRIGEPPWQIKLIFVAKWRPAWPRQASSTDESSFVSLPVVDDDSVDLSEWRDLAVSGLCSMASEAWKAISKRAWRGGHTIKITRLHQTFLDFGCKAVVKSLNVQLLYAVADRLEKVLTSCRGVSLDPNKLRFYFDEYDKASVDRQPYLCAAYVHVAKAMNGRPTCMGIMTDKGDPHALKVQCTAFTLPNNFASQAPCVVGGAAEAIIVKWCIDFGLIWP